MALTGADIERIRARRRRGKKVLAFALLAFAATLAAMFAIRRLELLAPALVFWLVACGAAVYTGRAPPRP